MQDSEDAIWHGESVATQTTSRSRISPRSFYRAIAIGEAVTWTGLLLGMALKYGFDLPVAVLIAGSVHGLVFVTYALTAALVGVNQRWSAGRIAFAVFTAVVPYATIPFDRHLERRGLLDGDWRRDATDDPRDSGLLSRLLRWFLARPAVLAAIFAAAVVVIMTVLLIIGPPGGWN
jgi:integral membrane protein